MIHIGLQLSSSYETTRKYSNIILKYLNVVYEFLSYK